MSELLPDWVKSERPRSSYNANLHSRSLICLGLDEIAFQGGSYDQTHEAEYTLLFVEHVNMHSRCRLVQ
jgi:hypothetical protein